MSIQYTLPVRLRSAMPGLNPSACAWATRAWARLGSLYRPSEITEPSFGSRHFQRIVNSARFEFGQ